jgi:hypothetical protein
MLAAMQRANFLSFKIDVLDIFFGKSGTHASARLQE